MNNHSDTDFSYITIDSLVYGNGLVYSTVLSTDKWYFVVGTHDGSTMKIYVSFNLRALARKGYFKEED